MKQITEDFVSFEIAKLLQEKGFEGRMHTFYTADGTEMESSYVVPGNFLTIYRPTYQMALKWLREVHNIHIDVFIGSDESCDMDGVTIDEWHFWTYYITNTSGDMIYDAYNKVDVIEHQTYEEAVEAALLYVLKNLI